MTNPKISIVVPSYNETAELKVRAIRDMDAFLNKQTYTYELLIIDDESTNGSINAVEEEIKNYKNIRLIKNSHGGKAITVMTGLLEATGEIAVFTDMDQATPIEELNKLLPKFEEGYDIVIGSRSGRKGAPPLRKLTALGFMVMRTIILGLPYTDTQCGFKGFTNKAIKEIFPDMLKRWKLRHETGAAVNAGFDSEVLYIAKKRNLKVAEARVEWHHIDNDKQVNIVKEAIESTIDMLKIRWNALNGLYRR